MKTFCILDIGYILLCTWHTEPFKKFQFLFYIGVYLIHNVVLISRIQKSDSVIHTNVSILFHMLFPHRLLQITKYSAAAAAKSLQASPTLCSPMDGSPPGSPIPGNLQGRTLEWVAISFSSAWKWNMKVKSLSCVRLLVTPWTAAYQAPLSMGFSRQEDWSGVPLPSLYILHIISL